MDDKYNPRDEDEPGIPCPDCGCRESSIYRTVEAVKKIRRERICGRCGRKYPTYEKIPE